MKVDLPSGGWAEIKSRNEITEREFRRVDRERAKSIVASIHLEEAGFDHEFDTLSEDEAKATFTPEEAKRKSRENLLILNSIPDEDRAAIQDYQTELILACVTSWSFGELTPDAVIDRPKPVFEALAKACQTEFDGTKVDTEADPN